MDRQKRWLIAMFVSLAPVIVCAQTHEIWTLWHQQTVAKIDSVTGAWTQYGTGMIDPKHPSDPPGPRWTMIGVGPDNRIFVVRRELGVVGEIFLYSLTADNIVVSGGNVINLQFVGTTGMCDNVDGLAVGPEGNLYITAYHAGRFVPASNTQAAQCIYDLPATNGLYRYVPGTNTMQFVGKFGNGAKFYTDLAFDTLPLPLGGDLVGQGIDSTGTYRLYTLPRAAVLTGTNQTFAFTPLGTSALDPGYRDGVAFDALTGDLFIGDDARGVYRVSRTGASPVLISGTSPDLGWDLANRVRGCSDAKPIRTLCIPGSPGDYSFTFEITNHSGRTMSSLSIIDPLPATVSPHSQPLSPPLPDNGTRLVTVTIHGAAPGQVVCLDGVLFDQECPNCCKFHICTTIPDCRCIQIYTDRGPSCSDANGTFTYSFELQNLSPQTLGALFIHGPAGVTITPDYVPLTPPIASNGGIDTAFHTITISGATPGTQLCLDFSVLDADLHQCCSKRVCIVVPHCEGPVVAGTSPDGELRAEEKPTKEQPPP